MNILEYLDEKQVPYEELPHRETFDAQHMAQALHVPGKMVAKTVLLKADGGFRFVVAVVPAPAKVDFERMSKALGGSRLELASEADVAQHCPDCELGVLPPFGSKYGLKTLVDDSVASSEWVIFEGPTHHQAIRMRFEDYRRIENPIVSPIAAG
jgi:Ala-tRNA(Pro) deacylase